MLLAEPIALAAKRWFLLLRTSTYSQAWSLIQADARYTDVTKTQYSVAFDWLRMQRFVLTTINGIALDERYIALPVDVATELLFEKILRTADLPWLPDADKLIRDPDELPQDAANVATILGLTEQSAFLAVQRVHGHVDLEKRAAIGAAGEQALFALLEAAWPSSTTHVSKISDGFGYDLSFVHEGREWHIEVKSTVRQGRLSIYLSRYEFEVGSIDPNWRLVLIVLNQDFQMQSLATVQFEAIKKRAPVDTGPGSKWQTASFVLSPGDLAGGLDFIDDRARLICAPALAKST